MKFRWYDVDYLRPLLIDIVERNLGVEIKDESYFAIDGNFKTLHQLQQLLEYQQMIIFDNTGHVKHPFNVIVNTPYNYRPSYQNFDEICIYTAEKISQCTNKKIAVLWSGGIDSTVALVALLQTVPHDRLVVVANQHSIDEYQNFYNDIIHKKIKTIGLQQWSATVDAFYTVSGDAGDGIWAGNLKPDWEQYGPDIHRPWQQIIATDSLDINFVSQMCRWSGREIRSYLDLRAWFVIGFTSSARHMEFYNKHPSLSKDHGTGFYSFNDFFRIWTINNTDKIIGDTWEDYKWPAKKFIYQYHPDQLYLKYKLKEYSVSVRPEINRWIIKNKKTNFAISEDYQHIDLENWPIIDEMGFKRWNAEHQLIPFLIANS